MSLKVLVFDLDGTLVDTMGDYADRAASLMESHFGTPYETAHAKYFETSGLPFCDQLKILYPDTPQTAMVANEFECWKDRYLETVTLDDNIRARLLQWQHSGMKIAVSSNNLDIYVSRMAADWPVDLALGFNADINQRKGEPHFRRIMDTFNVHRHEMLFTGDSLNDLRIAMQSDVPFCGLIGPAFSAADFESILPGVRTVEQLQDILAEVS